MINVGMTYVAHFRIFNNHTLWCWILSFLCVGMNNFVKIFLLNVILENKILSFTQKLIVGFNTKNFFLYHYY